MDSKQDENLSVCLACLGTGRMYNIRENSLLEPYLQLTGLKIPEEDIQARHFCQFCSTLLKKYAAFRERCLRSFEYLKCVGTGKILINPHITTQSVNILDYNYVRQDVTINVNCDIKEHNQSNNQELNQYVYLNIDNSDIKHERNSDDQIDVKETSNIVGVKIDHNNYNHAVTYVSEVKEELNIVEDFIDTDNEADNGIKFEHNDCDPITDERTDCDIKIEEDIIISNLDKNVNTEEFSKNCTNVKYKKKDLRKTSKTIADTKLSKIRLSTEEGRRIYEKRYGVSVKIMTEDEKITDHKDRCVKIVGGVQCTICFKNFENEKLLKVHITDNHDMNDNKITVKNKVKPLSCRYCGYRTDTKASLQVHNVRYHKYRITCLACGLLIRMPSCVAEHHRTHTGQTFTCRFCELVCKKSKQYRLHLRKAHPSELIWCNICGEVYINLENHLKQSHKEVLKSNIKCMKCNSYFVSLEGLEKHANAQTDKPCDVCCYHCAESFADEVSLRQHFEKEHMIKLTKRRAPRRQKVKPNQMQKGRKYNTNGTGGVCDVCGKVMRTDQGMEYHMLIHKGDLPFSCERCDKKFRCKTSLENHSRLHSGERPFSCDICQKAFTSRAGLHRHGRVHTGEKTHQCEICSKFYSTSSGLKAHVKAVHMKMPVNK